MSSSFYLTTPVEERLAKGSLEGIVKVSGQGQHGNQGRAEGSTRSAPLSPDVKSALGALGKLIGHKQTEVLSGINRSTVGNYSRGKNSSGKEVDPEVKQGVEDRLGSISEKATSALDLVLGGLLDPSRLADAKARDLGGIAANLSSVVERLRGKNNVLVAGQVILMAPKTARLDGYEVIEAETRVLE